MSNPDPQAYTSIRTMLSIPVAQLTEPKGWEWEHHLKENESFLQYIDFRNLEGKFHIQNLRFAKADTAKSLSGADEWKNLPPLCILTGRNGSGKSHLLGHINSLTTNLTSLSFPFRVIFEPSGQDNPNKPYRTDFYVSHHVPDDVVANLTELLHENKEPKSFDQYLSKQTLKVIQDEVQKQKQKKGDVLSTQEIKEIILRHFPSKVHSFTTPLEIVNASLKKYTEKKQAHLATPVPIKDLFIYVTEEKLDIFRDKINKDDFVFKIDNMYRELAYAYLEDQAPSKLGLSPLEEMNDILRKYKFYLEVELKLDILLFKRREFQQAKYCKFEELSSGEKMIVEMLSWLFYHKSNSIHDERPVTLMLLDEPDRHLDPKLIELFFDIIRNVFVKEKHIQVILTTHRTDTIALAPKESIFLLDKDKETGVPKIISSHRLRALFRLTSNLREVTNLHLRVYTESTSDAQFYDGVYYSLMRYCGDIRKDNTSQDLFWLLDSKKYRLLSQRYQLSFFTTSTDGKKNGGCDIVKDSVSRDINAFKNNSIPVKYEWIKRITSDDPKILMPYGIVDNDGKREETLAILKNQHRLDKRIEIPEKRYSLENFLFDPVIFCSVTTKEDLEKHISKSNIPDKLDTLAFDQNEEIILQESTNDLSSQKLKDSFIFVCGKVKKALEEEEYTNLQNYLNIYFKIMFETIHQNKGKLKRTKDTQISLLEDITQKVKTPTKLLCDETVTLIVSIKKSIEVNYPKEFLLLRGHDLGDAFIGNHDIIIESRTRKNIDILTDLLILHVYEDGIKFIPGELADVFFGLNEKVRSNIRDIICK